jgi:cytidylate kinase
LKPLLITIDGPAGAGKSTVCRDLARRLGYRYVDTGALYRGVAREAKRSGIDPDDEAIWHRFLPKLDLKLTVQNNETRLISSGNDISDFIRGPEITALASRVSAIPLVRRYLLDVQRDLGKEKSAVFEGRDMGTVVFPDADVKFYLVASSRERAKRRWLEMKNRGEEADFETVFEQMQKRDERDRNRDTSPLKAAKDAIRIDSTGLGVREVVEKMTRYIFEGIN